MDFRYSSICFVAMSLLTGCTVNLTYTSTYADSKEGGHASDLVDNSTTTTPDVKTDANVSIPAIGL